MLSVSLAVTSPSVILVRGKALSLSLPCRTMVNFLALGQASLSNTCPVCTHTPVAPDLCKPNKALRTTLKAFLRTEEKKRERDRQSVATPSNATPADPNIAESTSPNGVPITTEKTEPPVRTESAGPKHEVLETVGARVDASVIHTAEDVTQPPPTGTIDIADETVQVGSSDKYMLYISYIAFTYYLLVRSDYQREPHQ